MKVEDIIDFKNEFTVVDETKTWLRVWTYEQCKHMIKTSIDSWIFPRAKYWDIEQWDKSN